MLTLALTITVLLTAAPAVSQPESASWLLNRLRCIHRYEGAWTDPGAPYWGGLQMDAVFERTYGPEFVKAFGHADRWPPAVQLAVAMRAVLSGQGFQPWPTSRRRCGV